MNQNTPLFEESRLCTSPFTHLVGRLDPSLTTLLAESSQDASTGELCPYGQGQRRQVPGSATTSLRDPLVALARHPDLRAFVIGQSEAALGMSLKNKNITIHARRCVDESEYFLSPHADCPKTICALLIYLWNGQRGTSLYRLAFHNEMPPMPEPGLRQRLNNFHGNDEYERANLDVITRLKPDCFAYYEHVKLVRPITGTFLFLPNTRFSGALPDLPQSHHGVASRASALPSPERRHLVLIDVKQADAPPPSWRSRLKARLKPSFRSPSWF